MRSGGARFVPVPCFFAKVGRRTCLNRSNKVTPPWIIRKHPGRHGAMAEAPRQADLYMPLSVVLTGDGAWAPAASTPWNIEERKRSATGRSSKHRKERRSLGCRTFLSRYGHVTSRHRRLCLIMNNDDSAGRRVKLD